jgi:sugar phosphate isomerase/epimerase
MLWISTTCMRETPLDIALESLGSLTRGVEIVDEGLHRIPAVSLLESFPYKYMIRLPQREINPASILEPVRQASVAVITERFELASEIGAEVVVDPGFVSSKSDLSHAKRQLARSCVDIIHAADEFGIRFLFRNMGKKEGNMVRYPEDINLITQIPLALDIGHAHVNGCLPKFLHEAASRCYYLYDCREFSEEHLEIGRGTIHFDQVAASMFANGARGIIDAPTFRAAHNSLIALRRFGIG